jgi:glycosyltransferase involved in cell wall biosynthesis
LPPEVEYTLPLTLSNNQYLRNNDIVRYRTFFPHNKFTGRTTIIQAFNARAQKRAFRSDYDIFHPTYYDPYFLPAIGQKPFVLTVHDLTYEKLGITPPRNDWAVEGMRRLAPKAARIIAVSENTKNDLVECLQIAPDKIEVIYHGCSLQPHKEKTLSLPKRFLLFVGERGGYKNFAKLAEAFARLRTTDPDLKLIACGKAFSAEETAFLGQLNIAEQVLQYSVNDSSLAELYASALAFVYPSVYEGFGIPILEAFTCGCPVVLSQSSCFPEIAGKACEYFDPANVDSIEEAIRQVIDNVPRRNELIALGKQRITLFSWEKTAQQTVEVYRSVLNI